LAQTGTDPGLTSTRLHQQGVKQADIAKQLGCHRNTVRDIIKREARLRNAVGKNPHNLTNTTSKSKKGLLKHHQFAYL
jgi:IS30 family transposase